MIEGAATLSAGDDGFRGPNRELGTAIYRDAGRSHNRRSRSPSNAGYGVSHIFFVPAVLAAMEDMPIKRVLTHGEKPQPAWRTVTEGAAASVAPPAISSHSQFFRQ
jgi:hypothetical protein